MKRILSAFFATVLVSATSLHGATTPEPAFVAFGALSSGRTVVFGVAETPAADIVLLESGLDQGFRTGALCTVSRGDGVIAELTVIESRTDRAAALISALGQGSIIRSGDTVTLKTTLSQ